MPVITKPRDNLYIQQPRIVSATTNEYMNTATVEYAPDGVKSGKGTFTMGLDDFNEHFTKMKFDVNEYFMNLMAAIDIMYTANYPIQRRCWGDKFLYYDPTDVVLYREDRKIYISNRGLSIAEVERFDMKTITSRHIKAEYVPSMRDVLANDWRVIAPKRHEVSIYCPGIETYK